MLSDIGYIYLQASVCDIDDDLPRSRRLYLGHTWVNIRYLLNKDPHYLTYIVSTTLSHTLLPREVQT